MDGCAPASLAITPDPRTPLGQTASLGVKDQKNIKPRGGLPAPLSWPIASSGPTLPHAAGPAPPEPLPTPLPSWGCWGPEPGTAFPRQLSQQASCLRLDANPSLPPQVPRLAS